MSPASLALTGLLQVGGGPVREIATRYSNLVGMAMAQAVNGRHA